MQPDRMMNFFPAFPIIFGLIWLAFWIFIIIVLWRWMRAHERVADSLRSIAASWRAGERGPGGA